MVSCTPSRWSIPTLPHARSSPRPSAPAPAPTPSASGAPPGTVVNVTATWQAFEQAALFLELPALHEALEAARELLQHDLDASPLFPRYEVPLTGRSRFPTDPDLSNALATAALHCLQHAAEPRKVAVEESADFAVVRLGREQQRHLRHGHGPVADRLAGAAEPGGLGHERHLLVEEGVAALLADRVEARLEQRVVRRGDEVAEPDEAGEQADDDHHHQQFEQREAALADSGAGYESRMHLSGFA